MFFSVMSANLRLIPWLIEYSKRVVRVIQWNLAWSFGYNLVGVIVAACGYLHPSLAATLMLTSSLIVLANSLRLSNDSLLPGAMTDGRDESSGDPSNPSQQIRLAKEAT